MKVYIVATITDNCKEGMLQNCEIYYQKKDALSELKIRQNNSISKSIILTAMVYDTGVKGLK